MEDLKQLSLEKFTGKQRWIGDDFAGRVRKVYATSNRRNQAREIIVDIVLHKKDLLQEQSIKDLIREGGDFVADLVTAMAALS